MKCRVAEQLSIAASVLFVFMWVALLRLQPFAEASPPDAARLHDDTRAVAEDPDAVFQLVSHDGSSVERVLQDNDDLETAEDGAPMSTLLTGFFVVAFLFLLGVLYWTWPPQKVEEKQKTKNKALKTVLKFSLS